MNHKMGEPDESFTTKHNHHNSCGFFYIIKCIDESTYPDKTVLYTMTEPGKDIGKKFVECLERDLREVYKILKTNKSINMTESHEIDFQNAIDCYACGKPLGTNRVRDHCHLTGKYRGAAHERCNHMMKRPNFVPVLFHNLEGYDSHLFNKCLGFSEGKINCIPKTYEMYISFSKNIVIEK